MNGRELRAPPTFVMEPIVRRALEEDLGWGDVTSEMLIPASATARARLVARQPGTICGILIAEQVFHTVDAALRIERVRECGDTVSAGDTLMEIEGAARSLLAAERVALNFVQRLSGIATLTAEFVAAVAGTKARIVDSRKTTPGLRVLEKYAVRCGGGINHRWNLGDAVLIKDNHIAALRAIGTPLAEAIAGLRSVIPHVTAIEVEVDTLDQLDEVIPARPDAILLDNMGASQLVEAVRRAAGIPLEASGGITLATARAAAEAGIDIISVGALTHSPGSFDAALDFIS